MGFSRSQKPSSDWGNRLIYGVSPFFGPSPFSLWKMLESWVDWNDFFARLTLKSRDPNEQPDLVGGLVAMNFIFPEILGMSYHPNWLIFFRGVAQPPTRDMTWYDFLLVQFTWPADCQFRCHRDHIHGFYPHGSSKGMILFIRVNIPYQL